MANSRVEALTSKLVRRFLARRKAKFEHGRLPGRTLSPPGTSGAKEVMVLFERTAWTPAWTALVHY